MSDYLSDEEQMARLQQWWRSNGVLLIVAVVLTIAAIFGWRWYQAQQQQNNEAASATYAQWSDATAAEQDALATKLLADYPDSAYAAFVRMQQAQEALNQGDDALAQTRLQEVLSSGAPAVVVDLARLRLASLQQQAGDTSAALTTLGTISAPGFESRVAELKGDILLQQGDRSGAHAAYARALETAGDGSERPVLSMKHVDTATPDDARYGAGAADPEQALDAESVSESVAESMNEDSAGNPDAGGGDSREDRIDTTAADQVPQPTESNPEDADNSEIDAQ